jgi:penicillin-binding protein 1A
MFSRWWLYPIAAFGALILVVVGLVAYAALVVYPNLPALQSLTEYQPKIPLQIFSAEGQLIGEFGEERRSVVSIGAVPAALKLAIISAEDERFYQHGGVDYVGVLRAILNNFAAGSAKQGASTITMQVARNFFLTKEKTFDRKFREALLAFKIERSLSKDEILELYINQIYLGQRAYGFAAAAQVYFGKTLDKLNLAEMAMLAGLPKAPSRDNPVNNPSRAKARQRYVLKRLRNLEHINDAQLAEAEKSVVLVRHESQEFSSHAEFFTEMVRQAIFDAYKDEAYTKGLRVHTSLFKAHQESAYRALRKGVIEYDQRHGYRGPEAYVDLPKDATEETYEELLAEIYDGDDLKPAVVLEATPKLIKCFYKGGEVISISGEPLKFVARNIGEKVPPKIRLRPGAIIRVQREGSGPWQVAQLPQVEAALVSVDPMSGAIRALVGGFDYNKNKFNHVTQAYRQPGSSFKPFIYSAALEKGFTPATIINDAPISFDASETGSVVWEPKNFDRSFDGPIRMRTALTKSKNLVSIRILQAITPQYAQDYIGRFGFDPKLHPAYLTMALGAGSATPLQMVMGYSTFANGGFRVTPYFIERIEDSQGTVLAKAAPVVADKGAERMLDPRNAFLMSNMMQDVIRGGTGIRAMQLGRSDLAGKTGTTNEQVDAWFAGFQKRLVAVAWIGFDAPHSLGDNETGAVAALPIWMSYMATALKGLPEDPLLPPSGVIAVPIDPATGLHDASSSGAMVEYFYQENPPPEQDGAGDAGSAGGKPTDAVKDQLY